MPQTLEWSALYDHTSIASMIVGSQ